MSDSYSERTWRIIEGASFNSRRALRVESVNETQFGENLTAQRTPIIELNSSYGVSELRDLTTTTNSGSITSASGSIDISTGTTADSTAFLSSSELGRYIPGYGAQIGLGILLESTPVGSQVATWGGIGEAEDNGIYFGQDSTGVFVAVEKSGTQVVKVYQGDWNIDNLDGNGVSKYNLDTSNGVIFQIEFTWYGFGQLLFGVVAVVADTNKITKENLFKQVFIPVHSVKMDGEVSLQTPNMRVFAKVDNGTETSDLTMEVGGRQYSIVGNYIPKYRFTNDFRASASTSATVTPLVSFRRKSGFGDRSIKVQGFDIIPDTADHIIEIRLNPDSLTGESFGTPTNHTASETALESDTSATAITGGIVIWQQIIRGSQNQNSRSLASRDIDFDIPNGQIVSLCARTVTGTDTINLCDFRLREEW